MKTLKPRTRRTDDEGSEHWRNRRTISLPWEFLKWIVVVTFFAGGMVSMYKIRIQATVDKVELQACEIAANREFTRQNDKCIAVIQNDIGAMKNDIARVARGIDTLIELHIKR